MCGNGVLEAGETCDCGASDCSARDPCCVGSTCQLKVGALCSAGEGADGCCDPATCAAKPAATLCRAKSDLCDVEETCDGSGFACPHDRTVEHAVACVDSSGDKGSCWGKACVNRNATCHGITSERFVSVLYGGKTASESCNFFYRGKKMHVFDAASCDADFRCFKDWNVCQANFSSTYTLPTFGALPGFPCSGAVEANETVGNATTTYQLYPMVWRRKGKEGRSGGGDGVEG